VSMRPIPKLNLVLRVWSRYAIVRSELPRHELPDLVARLGTTGSRRTRQPIWRLAGAVDRSLRVGTRRPTCLVNALVLFRLLREQDEPAELVIGLPKEGETPDAHAWVEVRGVDVGPSPGRNGHQEMARFS